MTADFLKPSDREIRELALRETDPARVEEFQPITKGPVVAVLILACVGIAAIPLTLWRLVSRGVRQ
jgi:plastocyanin domain-containing protein